MVADGGAFVLTLGALAFAVTLFIRTLRQTDPRSALGPTGFPLLYMAIVLTMPLLYVVSTGKTLGSVPLEIFSWPVVIVAVVHLLSFAVGVTLVKKFLERRLVSLSPDAIYSDPVLVQRFLWSGRLLLCFCGLLSYIAMQNAGTIFNSPYGTGQSEFTTVDAVIVMAEVLLTPSAVLIFYGRFRRGERLMLSFDGMLLAIIVLSQVLVMGNRAAAIAPAILWLWFVQSSWKPRSAQRLLVVAASMAVLFLYAGNLRSGVGASIGPDPLNDLVLNISSPSQITYVLSTTLDSVGGFYGGSTYSAVFSALLPGIIRLMLGIDNPATAGLVYRDLVGYADGQGIGFAFTSEAYMNFGYVGVALGGLILGVAAQKLYSMRDRPSARSLFYPLLIATLPYIFRSDFLVLVKALFYPIVIVWVISELAKVGRRKSGQKV